ncbi:MAG: Glucosaminate ammonia-lyase [Alphaproteobacteria bacterium MarineAlpha9_Bin4]|nr:MAG: Glucosaminate ammonia-lyase [Alphaproteobacteria bacterium MarineAlpha9_Bin4]
MKVIKMNNIDTSLLILGSGPAGCTAAIYAARADLKPTLVHGIQPGGQLTITTDVENYPGFASPIQGPWLMEQMIDQAKVVGCDVVEDNIVEVDFETKPYKFYTSNKKVFSAKSVIISTGASAKWLGLETEKQFTGFGVSACATCDAFFFKDKVVVVVGGGNTAVEEALFLTKFASKVILIHRRDKLRAEKVLQKRLFSNNKVEIIWNSIVSEIKGQSSPKKVKSIKIKNLNDKSYADLNIDGIFIAIGHKPNTNLFINKLDLDQEGYIKTKNQIFTNIPGVFAAGDVHDKSYRQAVTAAGYGCMAALEAEKFLTSIEN